MKTTTTTIHAELKKLSVELGGHHSDLYCPVTPETIEVIENYEYKCNVTRFVNQIDGKIWFDIPFTNDDYFFGRTK